ADRRWNPSPYPPGLVHSSAHRSDWCHAFRHLFPVHSRVPGSIGLFPRSSLPATRMTAVQKGANGAQTVTGTVLEPSLELARPSSETPANGSPRVTIPTIHGRIMHPLAWLGIALLALWAVLWLGFKIVSGIIHLLVIVGVALLVWGLVKKAANAVRDRT